MVAVLHGMPHRVQLEIDVSCRQDIAYYLPHMPSERPALRSHSRIVTEPAILIAFEFMTPEPANEAYLSELQDYLRRLSARRLTSTSYVVASDASPINVMLETMTTIGRGTLRVFAFPFSRWCALGDSEANDWLRSLVGNVLR